MWQLQGFPPAGISDRHSLFLDSDDVLSAVLQILSMTDENATVSLSISFQDSGIHELIDCRNQQIRRTFILHGPEAEADSESPQLRSGLSIFSVRCTILANGDRFVLEVPSRCRFVVLEQRITEGRSLSSTKEKRSAKSPNHGSESENSALS
jgi:hypothetical protein